MLWYHYFAVSIGLLGVAAILGFVQQLVYKKHSGLRLVYSAAFVVLGVLMLALAVVLLGARIGVSVL